MTQRRSNTYQQLELVSDEFQPEEQLSTHLVISGLQPDALEQELSDLARGAEAFEVVVASVVDDIEVVALVAISGPAARVGDLAAFMGGAEVFSAS